MSTRTYRTDSIDPASAAPNLARLLDMLADEDRTPTAVLSMAHKELRALCSVVVEDEWSEGDPRDPLRRGGLDYRLTLRAGGMLYDARGHLSPSIDQARIDTTHLKQHVERGAKATMMRGFLEVGAFGGDLTTQRSPGDARSEGRP